ASEYLETGVPTYRDDRRLVRRGNWRTARVDPLSAQGTTRQGIATPPQADPRGGRPPPSYAVARARRLLVDGVRGAQERQQLVPVDQLQLARCRPTARG